MRVYWTIYDFHLEFQVRLHLPRGHILSNRNTLTHLLHHFLVIDVPDLLVDLIPLNLAMTVAHVSKLSMPLVPVKSSKYP